ncbi:MAG: GNAT family N-acetyltransferase [Patescibacteria group bacterium]
MVRKARVTDIKSILNIYNKVKLDRGRLGDVLYESEIQKNGFLLGLDTSDTFIKEVNEAYMFIVDEDGDKIVGYLIADHSEEQKYYDDEYKTWFDPELKNFYYQNPKGMTLASIAVDPQYGRKRIAAGLLSCLEDRLIKESYQYLFSIVTLAPVTNCPSITWHSKNGFKRLAMGKPRRLFDLDNYSGILLCKHL